MENDRVNDLSSFWIAFQRARTSVVDFISKIFDPAVALYELCDEIKHFAGKAFFAGAISGVEKDGRKIAALWRPLSVTGCKSPSQNLSMAK